MKHTLGEVSGQQDYRRPDSRFSDELLALYQQEGERSRRGSIRRGLWTAVFIYLLFAASDIVLIPDVAFYTIVARFAVAVSALLTLESSYAGEPAPQRSTSPVRPPSSWVISAGYCHRC